MTNDDRDIDSAVREAVAGEVGRERFDLWFGDSVKLCLTDGSMRVSAADQFTYERFREITKAVQKETGKKGKELFHPIRVALTGAVSGPELEKLIPIFEEGAKLALPRPVKSCAQRLREFAAAAKL